MEVDSKHQPPTYNRDEEMVDYEETKTNPHGFFSDTKSAAACSVRVAVRARPLVGSELFKSPNIIVKCYDQDNQLVIGKDRAFTFDKVFDIGTRQQDVFEICVKNLVLGCFQGYNATVLAYGQTGSGKTFTMGSGYTIGLKEDDLGIIPRVIKLIFEEVEKRKNKADIVIKCAFLEIYNEELHDLLDHQNSTSSGVPGAAVIDRFIQKKEIQIREEKNGNISLYGLREDKVNSAEEMAACLDKGSNFRSTASTLMNNCSSRSHAIFTITIEQSIIEDLYKPDGASSLMITGSGDQQEEYMVAKFHFVDLAGSERAKRTGATGNTLKEGISINKGLLALGNVIAALTEEGKKNHVPYRDSKLTRILQDSLGGNSRTSMIACVSPAEINFEETLNTLKYASRARNIKNAPKVNRDPNSAQIAQLRQQVFDLQRELQGCKKLLISNHIEFDSSQMFPQDIPLPGRESMNPSGFHQIQQLEHELKEVKAERQTKEKKIVQLLTQIENLNDQSAQQQIDLFSAQKERDQYRFNLEQIISSLQRRGLYQDILNDVSLIQLDSSRPADPLMGNQTSLLDEYQTKIETLNRDLQDQRNLVKTLQRDNEQLVESGNRDLKNLELKEQEIERLKRLTTKLQKEIVDIKNEARRSNFQSKANYQPQVRPQSSDVTSSKKKPLPVTKTVQNRISEGVNPQWMNEELDIDITRFNKEFIDNLSQKLTVGMFANPTVSNPTFPDDQVSALDVDAKDDSDSSDDVDEAMSSDDDVVLAVPKDEKEQQLVIESLEETKHEDSLMRTDLQHKEQAIVSLDDELKKREQFLQLAVEQQKELSHKLVEAMKNEYHKKIHQLQIEQLNMEQERAEQLRKAETMQQKSKVDENFKKKAKELEEKLAIAKAKEREQIAMQKQSEMQRQRIKGLESEIEKIKTQKVIMMKQMKEESEKHRKWKQDKVKEIMQIRALNLKQDREIQMLRRENKKKEQINKRKQEEINALQKRSKNTKAKYDAAQKDRQKKKQIDIQHVQNWIISNTEKLLRYKELQTLLQGELEQKSMLQGEIEEETAYYAQMNVRREKLEYRGNQIEAKQNEDPQSLSLQEQEEMFQIQQELEQLNLELRAQQENLDSLEERNDFIEGKISNIKTQLIEFNPSDVEELRLEVNSIEAARTCLSTFFTILLDVNVDKSQLENLNQQQQVTIDQLVGEVEQMKLSLEASQMQFQKHLERLDLEHRQKEELLFKFIMENGGTDQEQIIQAFQNIYSQFTQLSNYPNDQNKEKPQKKLNKAQNAKMEIQKNNQQIAQQSKFGLSKKLAELERDNLDKERRFEAIRHKLEQTNAEKETLKRQYDTLKNQVKQQGISEIKQLKTLASEQVEITNMQQAVSQLSNAQSSKMHTLREARNQKKLQKMADVSKKQVNEPRVIADEPMDEDEQLEVTPSNSEQKDRRSIIEQQIPNSSSSRNNEQNVFTRLNQHARNKSAMGGSFADSSSIQHQVSNNALVSQDPSYLYEEDPLWKCITVKEQAHTSSIYAIASSGNQFYSTSNKNLKIWNFETMTLVSDIGAHQSYIRCLTVWGERKLLLTASDKTIILWDQISLTQVAQLKGHKEEIRALAVQADSNGQLFSAGKGSQQGGSLLIWDLRKNQNPIEEREKNQDVFCLQLTKDYLYMGCRNHSVYPVNLQTYETLPPLEPPHFDAVTSLSPLQDGLMVSGSRDKNLRLWNQSSNQPYQAQQVIEKAHSDYINCLESVIEDRLMYSGSRDGVVKVWRQLPNKQLKCTAQLSNLSGTPSANGGNSINTICKIDKQCGGTMFASAGADRTIRIWKYLGQQPSIPLYDDDHDLDDYLKEDGKPDFEMIDENPSPVKPLQAIDDEFEFEEPVVVGGGGFGPQRPSSGRHHPQFKHMMSQRVSEEVKSEHSSGVQKVRNINRSSSGMMVAQNSIQQVTSMVAGMANKLEQKRRERRMQGDMSRKNGDI